MRVVQRTIARSPDALAETCWSEIQELPPVRHVLLRTAYDTQGMSPLMPCRTHDECLIGGLIEAGQLGMADIKKNDAEPLKPDAQRKVEPALRGRSEPSGGIGTPKL